MPSRGEYSGQDWGTISFSNTPRGGKTNTASTVRDAQRSGAQISQDKKHGGGGNSMTGGTGISATKLENETDELKHATVSTDLKQAIIKARNAKGLTQKQLAQQLNMQPQVINEYEAGKAIPNNAIIAKIERALGAKLPRAKK
uniref:HTH cro/C1-type domain-containing protein n=1 Tax=Haptolina ericina TaxID=156174 RepID=A0A7S3F1H1_9EUKA|mmetsp:Transcript_39465/g.89545  ORF Transcript_39465/g.89545 Transcript_39465/m.89545 type:complete len:143 (+) Transcript_39465:44-472(+)|eukprot:CAMPEP_0181211596 /NCGR_PEP_ID=MMETSP1096-20121128/23880_1 /TAXON_ID=156174 ORGANISM="Chrysochromulina ericina, Strain CCMP281" /NCGR_SAMPLE_ID=MMETSP1096 /ASSEMBLY_ACC=CAM_ASM_000453 /LENGTH=142 /DNA_ID=CAMNT_0023303027 /DNA_START=44 /DNA_END=472 /DNA_ORIENTATION=-